MTVPARPIHLEPGSPHTGPALAVPGRRAFLLALTTVAPGLGLAATAASDPGTAAPATLPPASAWPRKAIRLIVPTSPGSDVDRIARTLADPLGRLLGQSIVVESRPGNHGNLAATLVGDAPSDGYTLLMATETMPCINTLMYTRGSIDPHRKLIGINQIADTPLVLLTHRMSRFRSLTPLLRQARRNREVLHYGCQGYGSASHLAMLSLHQETGLPFDYRSFKDTRSMLQALQAGELELACLPADPAFSALADGRVRAIGLTSAKRNPLLPQVMPLAQQSGVANGFRFEGWLGLLAPAHTPSAILIRINDALIQSSQHPPLLDALRRHGYERRVYSTPDDFQTKFGEELTRNRRIIERAGLRLRH
ncbi:MAG: tripartite tricarboxylate transporter substrate binding protein [Lautropia sp.]|nr:tripartite tricarboxylate transporter substrate binding protein [Lautropia sp.]